MMKPRAILLISAVLAALWMVPVPHAPAQAPTEEDLKEIERQAEQLEKKQEAEAKRQAEAKRKAEAAKQAEAKRKAEAAKKAAAAAEAKRQAAEKKADEERRAAEERKAAREQAAALGDCDSFDGHWDTHWGPLTIHMDGNRATGTYQSESDPPGTIVGSVSLNILEGEWMEASAKGSLRLELSADGETFVGGYQYDDGFLHHTFQGWRKCFSSR